MHARIAEKRQHIAKLTELRELARQLPDAARDAILNRVHDHPERIDEELRRARAIVELQRIVDESAFVQWAERLQARLAAIGALAGGPVDLTENAALAAFEAAQLAFLAAVETCDGSPEEATLRLDTLARTVIAKRDAFMAEFDQIEAELRVQSDATLRLLRSATGSATAAK